MDSACCQVPRRLKAIYAPVLNKVVHHSGWTMLASLALTVPAIALSFYVGTDFMPRLDEGAFLIQTILPPEASLAEVDPVNHRVEDALRTFPEVEDVVRRTGRAERTEDPMSHTFVRRAGGPEAAARQESGRSGGRDAQPSEPRSWSNRALYDTFGNAD